MNIDIKEIKKNKKKKKKKKRKSKLPIQVVPGPKYPSSQEHEKLPRVFWQIAKELQHVKLGSQGFPGRGMRLHSSISMNYL